MYSTLAIPFAKLVQFKLRRSALHIYLSAIIAVTAILAFQPNIFTLLRSCHKNLTLKYKISPMRKLRSKGRKHTSNNIGKADPTICQNRNHQNKDDHEN
jgi:hypothetical protein